MYRPLRVLQITSTLEIGGMETLIVELSNQLSEHDIYVEIICFSDVDPDYVIELKKHKIPIHIFKKKHRLDVVFWSQMVRFMRKQNFDIVHSHGGCALQAALCSRLAGINNIYTAHGMPISTSWKDRIEDTFACLLIDKIVAVSHELEAHLRKWHLLCLSCYTTIINGVDTGKYRPLQTVRDKKRFLEKYHLPSDTFIIGSVGRLESLKNYEMLLYAFAQLFSQHKANLQLVLVGEGDQKEKLSHLANSLGIRDSVCFLGMQYNVYEILPLFNVFVLSSLTEGTSIALLEAQSCGVPAIVTDVGGNGFIISHKENGFLCPLNDIRGMTKYLKVLCNNYGLRKAMGERARQCIVNNFSLNTMTQKYKKLYFDLCDSLC